MSNISRTTDGIFKYGVTYRDNCSYVTVFVFRSISLLSVADGVITPLHKLYPGKFLGPVQSYSPLYKLLL